MWHRTGRDSLVFAASALLLAALQVAFRFVSIASLPIADYGRAALVIGVFNSAFVLSLGVPPAAARLAARGLAGDRELALALVKSAIVPVLLGSVTLVAGTAIVARSWLDCVVAAPGLLALVFSIVAAGFLRGKGRTYRAALIQPVNGLAQLAALGAIRELTQHVTVSDVLGSFYLGNAAAACAAAVLIVGVLKKENPKLVRADADASSRALFAFSTWVAIAAGADTVMLLAPRVALGYYLSYRTVALFDLALLMYTVPQRLTSSVVIALVPEAARAQLRQTRVRLPGPGDAVALCLLFGGLAILLWATHAVAHALDAVHLNGYARSEGLFLLVLLAAPGQLLFGLNSGLLQAFGRSKPLAKSAFAVLLVSLAAIPVLTVVGGAKALAVLVAADYWTLYLVSRRLLRSDEVLEKSITASLVSRAYSQRAAGSGVATQDGQAP